MKNSFYRLGNAPFVIFRTKNIVKMILDAYNVFISKGLVRDGGEGMKRYDLNHGWTFYENDEGMGFNFGRIEGKPITLPHDFIIKKERKADAPGGAGNGYFGQGQGNYKNVLSIPAEWQGKTVLLDIDGAYMNAEVVLNGQLLALHPYGYTPFLTDLTSALRFDGRKNTLKVTTQSRQPSSRWYAGGGLYRSVNLWVGNPIQIRPWDVFVSTVKADEEAALLKAKVRVTGPEGLDTPITVKVSLKNVEGGVVAEETGTANLQQFADLELLLSVNNPHLWNLENPYLYTWQAEVSTEEGLQDMAEGTCGIRTIAISVESGFELNGKPLKLKGGCLHHDNGLAGACAYPKAEERKIKLLKSVGYNAVRISHYPPSLELLEVCDRLGMLVLDEAFDVWRLSKTPMDYHLYFEDWWERDLESMVLRDRNHPSVITYSIGNEIGERDGSSDGAAWSKKLAEKVRSLDNTRFVLSALCGVFEDPEEGGSNFDANEVAPDLNNDSWAARTEEFVAPLDIVGYNYLFARYENDHEKYPERIMMGTETHSLTTWDNWQAVMAHPYVLGDFIWTAMDYLGEVGVGKVYWESDGGHFAFMAPYPWRTSWQSDLELTGEQRPQSVFREIMWGKEEKSALYTTHPKHFGEKYMCTNWSWPDVNDSWTFEEEYVGKPVKVDVYGAGDEAEFFVNGKSLGRAPMERQVATLDVNYEPGVLEAVVYRDGQELSRCSLMTAGEAVKLAMRPEETTLNADGRDLCYLHVDIVDAEGRRLPADERVLTCKLEGEGAELVAIGSGCPCTEDPIGADWCHAWRGTAVIILKAHQPGKIKVSVEAEGLTGCQLEVEAK